MSELISRKLKADQFPTELENMENVVETEQAKENALNF
jgi:hypothetical protein